MSSLDRSFSEKRNFIRMKINTPATIVHAGSRYAVICQDLSADGMSVDTDQEFKPGDELEVAIEQQGQNHQSFRALAQVARVRANDQGGYNLGLAIKQILD